MFSCVEGCFNICLEDAENTFTWWRSSVSCSVCSGRLMFHTFNKFHLRRHLGRHLEHMFSEMVIIATIIECGLRIFDTTSLESHEHYFV